MLCVSLRAKTRDRCAPTGSPAPYIMHMPELTTAPPVSAHAVVSSAMISPNIIRYLMRIADESGVSLDTPLRAVGLTRSMLDNPTLRVSFRQGRVVIDAAIEALDDPALAVRVGGSQPITAAGLLGLAMMSSETVGDAVALGVRFQNLGGSMVAWSALNDNGTLAIVAAPGDSPSPTCRFLVEEGFSSFTRMARDVSDPGFRPLRVEFDFPEPAGAASFASYFGSPVVFDAGRSAWVLRPEQARRAIPTWDPWTLAESVAALEGVSAQMSDRQELVAALSASVESALPEVLPLGVHARALAMSERTLRRRLADVNASYSSIVDDVRRGLTERLVARQGLTFSDLAARIGYTDERSLRRAVHRWFGVTPAALRVSASGAR